MRRIFFVCLVFLLIAVVVAACDAAPLEDPRIIVFKSENRLLLYDGDNLFREYQIGKGLGDGAKVRQGDRKTPEGVYFITHKQLSRFTKFLGLSYPGIPDAEAGLKRKIISRSQYNAIVSAIERGQAPPQNTPLGGQVGIHGMDPMRARVISDTPWIRWTKDVSR